MAAGSKYQALGRNWKIVDFKWEWLEKASCLPARFSLTVIVGKMFPMLGEFRTRGLSLRIKSRPVRTEMRTNFLHAESCESVEFSATEGSGGQFTDIISWGSRNQGIWGKNRKEVLILDEQP